MSVPQYRYEGNGKCTICCIKMLLVIGVGRLKLQTMNPLQYLQRAMFANQMLNMAFLLQNPHIMLQCTKKRQHSSIKAWWAVVTAHRLLLNPLVPCRQQFQAQCVDLDETGGVFLIVSAGVIFKRHMLFGI